MNRFMQACAVFFVVGLFVCHTVLADGGKSPSASVEGYFKSILAKDADAALALVYIPDQMPTWSMQDAAGYNKKRIEANVREQIEGMIDMMVRSHPPEAVASPSFRAVDSKTNGHYAVVLVAPPRDEPTGQQPDPSPVFLIKTEAGWKLSFEPTEFAPLLGEDRKGQKECEALLEWATKRLQSLTKQGAEPSHP